MEAFRCKKQAEAANVNEQVQVSFLKPNRGANDYTNNDRLITPKIYAEHGPDIIEVFSQCHKSAALPSFKV